MKRGLILALGVLILLAGCGGIPERAAQYFNAGNDYYYDGIYHLAIDSFNKAIAVAPEYCEAYNNRGLAYQARGELDSAITDYGKAIACHDKNSKNAADPAQAAGPYNNRGTAYHEKANDLRALEDFNKAIELRPDFGKAYYNRGLLHLAAGDYDSAIQDFDQALQFSTDFKLPPDFRQRLTALPTGAIDLGQAMEGFTQQLKDISTQAGRAEILLGRGRAYYAQGSYDQAIEDFIEAIAYRSTTDVLAGVYNARGAAYYAMGLQDLAISDFSEAIPLLSAELTPAPTRIIDITKPKPRADDMRRIALQYADALAEAYYNRGLAYVAQGEIDLAVTDFKEVVKLGDDTDWQHAAEFQLALLHGRPRATPSPSPVQSDGKAIGTPTPLTLALAPQTPFAAYVPPASEAPVVLEPNTNQAACDGQPLYLWRSPGSYEYARGGLTFATVAPAARPHAPTVAQCPDMSNGWESGRQSFGERLAEPPVPGAEIQWGCGGQTSAWIRIVGTEEVTTTLGVFQALRVDGGQGYEINGLYDRYRGYIRHVEDRYLASEWWVCGYGLVRARVSHRYDDGGSMRYEQSSEVTLVSVAP